MDKNMSKLNIAGSNNKKYKVDLIQENNINASKAKSYLLNFYHIIA